MEKKTKIISKEIKNKIKELKGILLSMRLRRKIDGNNIAPSLWKKLKKLIAKLYSGAISVQEVEKEYDKLNLISNKWINKHQAQQPINEDESNNNDKNFEDEELIGEKIESKKTTKKKEEK